jgi:dTDP-4-dehydrorhamnose 3,5-epimerase
MKISELEIKGLILIELPIYKDNRGFFIERFNASKFADAGLPHQFMQDNHSYSTPNVIRGLHAQFTPPQGKLVGVARGNILDIAVDIRPFSPTFGQHVAIELSAENGRLLWVPGGEFAHGFCTLGDEPADVFYKVDSLYNPGGEVGIKWNDPDLNIKWPVKNPIVSQRDQENSISFAEYKQKYSS